MPPDHESARSRRLEALLVFLACLAIYAPTTAQEVVNDDVHAAAVAAWRVADTGSPWMDGLDVGVWGTTDFHMFNFEAANGHMVIHRSPGAVAANIPGYWLWGSGSDPASFSYFPQAVTAAVLTALGMALFYLTIRPRLRRSHALLATAVLALTTPMWSVVSNSLWTHTVTVPSIFGMAWAASRDRWWLVGLLGGLAVWGRIHVAVIVAVVGIGVSISRRDWRVAARVAIPSVLLMGLASVWSQWWYGTWSPAGGYSTGAYIGSVTSTSGIGGGGPEAVVANHLGLWIAPDRGVLIWTPLLLVLFPALLRGWRDLPDWARWLPVGGAVYMLVQGQLNLFTGGDGYFGHRLGTELLACVAPAYALTAARMGRVARLTIGPVIGAQFAAISLGAIAEGFFVYRDQAWSDNAFALALRTVEPLVGAWLLIMVTLGALAARVWTDRVIGRDPAATVSAARSA